MPRKGNTAYDTDDLGEPLLGVRRDKPSSIATKDGRYAPLELDADGNLRVVLPTISDTGVMSTEVRNNKVTSFVRDEDAIHLLEQILIELRELKKQRG